MPLGSLGDRQKPLAGSALSNPGFQEVIPHAPKSEFWWLSPLLRLWTQGAAKSARISPNPLLRRAPSWALLRPPPTTNPLPTDPSILWPAQAYPPARRSAQTSWLHRQPILFRVPETAHLHPLLGTRNSFWAGALAPALHLIAKPAVAASLPLLNYTWVSFPRLGYPAD